MPAEDYDPLGDGNSTDGLPADDFNATFEIRYWRVNRMDSIRFVNVSDGVYDIQMDDDNRTYIRYDLEGLESREYYSAQVSCIICKITYEQLTTFVVMVVVNPNKNEHNFNLLNDSQKKHLITKLGLHIQCKNGVLAKDTSSKASFETCIY